MSGMHVVRIMPHQAGWTEWTRRRTGPAAGTLADIWAVKNGDYNRSLNESQGRCDWLGIISAHATKEEAEAAMCELQWARWERHSGLLGLYQVIRFRNGTVVEHPDTKVIVTSVPTKGETRPWLVQENSALAWEWAEYKWPCFRWIVRVEARGATGKALDPPS